MVYLTYFKTLGQSVSDYQNEFKLRMNKYLKKMESRLWYQVIIDI